MFSALDSFLCLRLQVHLVAREHIELSPFRGSAIRGSLWMALRKSCCGDLRLACFSCYLRFNCEVSDPDPVESAATRERQVRLAEDGTRWYDWERYSHRQQRKMRLGGLVGKALYEGNLGPLAPYLTVGTWVRVGKGTSFGLGRFQVEHCAS